MRISKTGLQTRWKSCEGVPDSKSLGKFKIGLKVKDLGGLKEVAIKSLFFKVWKIHMRNYVPPDYFIEYWFWWTTNVLNFH